MSSPIPSIEEIRSLLSGLSPDQLDKLAERSGVPLPTLSKIRYGQTVNPGLETVRKFMSHAAELSSPAASQHEVRDAA